MTMGGYLLCPGMWTFVYAHKQPTEPTYILHGFIINVSTNEPHSTDQIQNSAGYHVWHYDQNHNKLIVAIVVEYYMI